MLTQIVLAQPFKCDLKATFAVLMVFAILLQNLVKTGLLIDFKIHQDFFAKVLCINKQQPDLKCNGSCQLTKQIKQADEHEKEQKSSTDKESFVWAFVCPKSSNNIKPFASINLDLSIRAYKNPFFDFNFCAKVFRPPQMA